MKALKNIILLLCCLCTAGASAQVTEIKSISTLKENEVANETFAPSSDWAYLFVDYSLNVINQPGENTSLDSFSFGLRKSLKRLGDKLPLYAESGLQMQIFFDDYYYEDNYNEKAYSLMMFSFKLPLNIVYEHRMGSVALYPYAGFSFRANLWGELELPSGEKYDLFEDTDNYKVEYRAFERFQFGSQVGVRLAWKNFNAALEAGMDFNEWCEATKLFSVTLAAGFSF